MLQQALEAEGRSVTRVREPGGTDVGERIRDLLLDPQTVVGPWSEALLYAAARAQLVEAVIRPALDRGAVVVADRFVDSSLAYQGCARGLGIDEVLSVNLNATGGLLPDRTILLELPAAAAAQRLRGAAPDRIEAEDRRVSQPRGGGVRAGGRAVSRPGGARRRGGHARRGRRPGEGGGCACERARRPAASASRARDHRGGAAPARPRLPVRRARGRGQARVRRGVCGRAPGRAPCTASRPAHIPTCSCSSRRDRGS